MNKVTVANALKNFLQVKKIIALILTIVFSILALKGTISSNEFMTVFSMVIAFYFAQSSTRQAINETRGDK